MDSGLESLILRKADNRRFQRKRSSMRDTMNNSSEQFPARRARLTRPALAALAACLLQHSVVMAQPGLSALEPWVQVEMTLFTYENANLDAEVWSPEKLSVGFPDQLLALHNVADVLQLDDWSMLTGFPVAGIPVETPAPLVAGPRPYAPGDSFTLPDLLRDAFTALPPSAQDFLTTNRTLSQSPAHRIVYQNAWRQPLLRRSATPAVGLRGGREFGERSEVEGSVLVYAAGARDRLNLEANLWLTQFGADSLQASAWTLPILPAALQAGDTQEVPPQPAYTVTRIIQFQQSREMRLDQFHYLDHPALGMLVQVTGYERPASPVLELPVSPEEPAASQSAAP